MGTIGSFVDVTPRNLLNMDHLSLKKDETLKTFEESEADLFL